MMSSERTRSAVTLLLLIMTSTLSTLSDNLYTPSLPYLTEYFSTTPEMVKYTVSLSMMAYGSGLLFFGPLSERFGRRPVLVTAMVVFTAMSLLCAFAVSIEQLIVGRVLQGMASGAEGVLVMAIIVDLFDAKGQVRVNSIYRAACAVPPIVTPMIGAYIFLHFGWQTNFKVLACVATVVTVALILLLPETNGVRGQPVSLREYARNYVTLLRSRSFLCLAVMMASTIGFLVVSHSAMPFVVVDVLHQPPQVIAYVQAVTMIALIAGYGATGLLSKRLPISYVAVGGLVVSLVGNGGLWYLEATNSLTVATFVGALIIIAFGCAPLLPTVPALVMKSTAVPTGQAAAMLLTCTSLLASATAVIEGRLSDGSVGAFLVVMTAWPILACLAYRIGVHGREFSRL